MALALFKTEQLKRYKDIVALLIKYGRSDLVKEAGLSTPAIRRESLVAVGKEPPPFLAARACVCCKHGRRYSRDGIVTFRDRAGQAIQGYRCSADQRRSIRLGQRSRAQHAGD